ncbi:MAG TPA: FAD-dependent oxidoreductase [Gemmatimonadales bacterium]
MTGRRDASHIAILGAGPVGLEAAAAALERGFAVTVFERGEVADHVRQWGHVPLFTRFVRNAGPAGRRALVAADIPLPEDDAFLTGGEWRVRYLLPLAEVLAARAPFEMGTDVNYVSRVRLLKQEAMDDPRRADEPFRLLGKKRGAEWAAEADIVLDCTGTWATPNWIGPGGTPALGERALRPAITYHAPDVLGAAFERYAGRRVLLVGGGDSAASSAVALGHLAARVPGTMIVWLTRTGGSVPLPVDPDDPLPGRRQIIADANALADGGLDHFAWVPDAQILSLAKDGTGFSVTIATADGERTVVCDEIIANVGYEPETSLYGELQVHTHWGTHAPMQLSTALQGLLAGADAEQRAVHHFEAAALTHPEPNFFILGAKSYGKNSWFLMETGYGQVGTVMDLLGRKA